MQIDLDKYSEFVRQVTSAESNDLTTFMNRLDRVDGNYETFDEAGPRHGPDVNIEKLKNRYPGGEFQAWYSENRQPGDL